MSSSGTITVEGGSTPVGLDLALTGSTTQPVVIDAGLSDIGISVGSPSGQPLTVDVGLTGSAANPITAGVTLGSPAGLPLGVSVTGNAAEPVTVGVTVGSPIGEPLGVSLTGNAAEPITVNLTLGSPPGEPLDIKIEPLKIDLGLDNINVCLSLALTQLPSMRVHMPKKYEYGFSLFGVPILGFRICGESSFVTEDNRPRVFHRAEPEAGFSNFSRVTHEPPFRVVLSE
jgi:hypothetical protein